MKPLKQRVAEKLTARLPDLTAEQIDDLVGQASEFFLAVTLRREVPENAFWTLTDLAAAFYRDSQSTAEGSGTVASIKRGDTTIEYASSGSGVAVSSMMQRIYAYKVAVAR